MHVSQKSKLKISVVMPMVAAFAFVVGASQVVRAEDPVLCEHATGGFSSVGACAWENNCRRQCQLNGEWSGCDPAGCAAFE